ncbi:uncharacterized protein EI97DRAFT_469313 [Westerdykella ornata]|uniref:Zn(2)-C6 fungal-type domain-containing protein n=1 Tax=Westerdykella ornata TaxID=318751 RepID=A0A6A6JBM3_WESOR|nr:uncharacterized protein EI97DRAFT_469313 [Westerdykella ornata]KAF2273832.1 hypothetical protein EI97DRAFT_469313 [Westerdykella ornata]
MVGTPRRTGCDTCRIRKKKCGEEYPECKACVSAKFPCPGYAKNWKFVPQNERLASMYKPHLHGSKRRRTGAVAVTWWSVEKDPYAVADLSKDNGFQHYFQPGICIFGPSGHERTAYLLGSLLHDCTARIAVPLVAQGSFYEELPRRLGRNPALDASVACLCHIWLDVAMKRNTDSKAVALYVGGLKALATCLDDARTQYESETICASIILQMCELALNADNGRWANLTRGTKLLIQNCGPDRFTSPFEHSMLDSQRAYFICHDMNDSQHCFLSQPEWRQVFSDTPTFPTERASFSLRSAACDLFVDVPEILFQGTRLRDEEREGPESRLQLLHQATTMHDAIEAWYHENLLPLISSDPSIPNEAQNASQRRYDDILMAVLDSISNTVLVSLRLLMACLMSDLPAGYPGRPDIPVPRLSMAERLVVSQSALAHVQRHSQLASKPLEFSLNLIRSYTNGAWAGGI